MFYTAINKITAIHHPGGVEEFVRIQGLKSLSGLIDKQVFEGVEKHPVSKPVHIVYVGKTAQERTAAPTLNILPIQNMACEVTAPP